MTKKSLLLVALCILLPATAWSQASRPPLGPVGPPISDLDLANRLKQAGLQNTEYIATLELSLKTSGDLWSVMEKNYPQGLFVTVEVNENLVKNVAKGKKPKVAEAIGSGPLNIKARFTRPGKRLEERCYGELSVGFQQVVFLPYGGDEGYFSCEIVPRLLPDDVFAEWKKNIAKDKTEAYFGCAGTHPRGSADFWRCIDDAGIALPDPPVG